MFFNSGIFWFVMGIIFILVAAGFKAFAEDRGWVVTWWKAALGIVLYGIFSLSFYAWGTLMGENEGSAGFKILILGLVVSLVLGAGFWRLMTLKTSR